MARCLRLEDVPHKVVVGGKVELEVAARLVVVREVGCRAVDGCHLGLMIGLMIGLIDD